MAPDHWSSVLLCFPCTSLPPSITKWCAKLIRLSSAHVKHREMRVVRCSVSMRTIKRLALGLMCLVTLASCATTETVETKVECPVTRMPFLPLIQSSSLEDLDGSIFWALEMEVALVVICYDN